MDVVIAGGGIVRAACAHALAMEKLRVVLVEAGGVGGGATAARMGHIVAMDDSEAQFALTSYSAGLWRAARPCCPRRSSTKRAARSGLPPMPKKWRPVRAKHAFYEQRGVSAEILGEKELREAEPNLREGLAGALLAPADSVVYAPCAAIFSHRGIQGEWRC